LTDLKTRFQEGYWQPAVDVGRPFVRYANPEHSPGVVWQYSPENRQSILSVVIPTLDAYRDGYLPELLAQIDSQDFQHFELIVVRGDPRQGRAINVGAALAQGKYLLTLDDDTALPDPQTFSKLVAIMEAHPEIGLAGGNNMIPTDASPFVRRVMQQIPRRSWNPVPEITDSDLAEHPCLMIRSDNFKALGGENELIPRGLDPYLREQFRLLGMRVVLVPGVIYHHMPPDSLLKLLQQFHRNGRHAAYVNRYYPEWVIETPANHGYFEVRKPFIFRVFRFPFRLVRSLIESKPILFLCEVAYASGFICELFVGKRQGWWS
jgi:GT2 family glycosyltransferase